MLGRPYLRVRKMDPGKSCLYLKSSHMYSPISLFGYPFGSIFYLSLFYLVKFPRMQYCLCSAKIQSPLSAPENADFVSLVCVLFILLIYFTNALVPIYSSPSHANTHITTRRKITGSSKAEV
ncbi:hypothetical protein HJG60_010671 [Phyllostomus discolor]|uniref:Uncharacterized protein n=1 Tax=Phyllostomus discolor TaxID=89673 RepID=A0A834ANK7_9CHIR|nr:hypothetical protein HJG60_010671 [Phyllostomus discolor]